MIINHNMASLNTYRQLSTNNANSAKSLEKLSSGLRINKAGDDAAGLAISEKMRGQIRGLDQAQRNSQDGISLLQTAEGALNETHSILQRMRELSVQSSNDAATDDDRQSIQKEMDQLAKEVTRISNTTEFNTKNLLSGAFGGGSAGEQKFQIGANEGQMLGVTISAMDAKSLGIARDVEASTTIKTNTASISTAQNDIANSLSDGTYTVNITADATIVSDGEQAAANKAVAGSLTATGNSTTGWTNLGGIQVSAVNADGSVAKVKFDLDGASDSFAGESIVGADGKVTIDGSEFTFDPTKSYSVGSVFRVTNTASGAVPTIDSLDASTDAATYDATTSGVFDKSSLSVSGSADINNVKVQISSVNADGSIKTIKVDDGSGTLGAETAYSANMEIAHGIKFTQEAGKTYTAGSSYQLDLTSLSYEAQLSTSSGTAIGNAVSITNDGSNTVLGDTSGTGVLNVSVASANTLKGQTQATVTVVNAASSSAAGIIEGNGKVSTEATVAAGLDISTAAKATAAITKIDAAINTVSEERSKLGAFQNRLEHTVNNLGTSSENLTAAESRIRDVDMAKEMMNFQKNNILSQAAQAMLAQANQAPQGVLQLLR